MKKQNVDLLIIIPPIGSEQTVYPPYGAMYIAASLKEHGYEATVINVDAGRQDNKKVIDQVVDINPRYIGISGVVATSYKYVKKMSNTLKEILPQIVQILGGGLANAVDPIFRHTAVDITIEGEGDSTIIELIRYLDENRSLDGVKGIHYRTGNSYVYTGKRPLIRNLDELPYPAFDVIDMDRYLPDGLQFIRKFPTTLKDKEIYDKRRKRKMMTIETGRGCFGQCSFCARPYPGIRLYSIKYVFDLIEYCIEKFDAGFFTFGDECFAPNKKRHWQFIEEYKRRNMDIIFRLLGVRVDTVDKNILRAYKEIGCWMIEYGFESGSQKMLNIIDKRVSVGLNREVARWTKEAGLFTSPTLVLAMPGENNETIQESIDFVKSLNFDFKQYQWTYALPMPNSPLYRYARITGAIEDEDEYLSYIYGERGGAGIFHINLTDEPDEAAINWADRVRDEVDAHYFNRKYKVGIIIKFMRLFMTAKLLYKKKSLFKTVIMKIKSSIYYKKKVGIAPAAERKIVRFRKKDDFKIDDLIKGFDTSRPNRDITLDKLNKKIVEKRGGSELD